MRKISRKLALTAAAAAAGYGALTMSMPAPVVAAPPQCPGGFAMEAGIGCTKELPNGNKLVHHKHGVQTETHGGDHGHAEMANTGGALANIAPERPVVCASSAPRSVAVYAHAAGSANRVDSMRTQIQAAVKAANGLLARDATATGVVADFRFACDSAGQPQVLVMSTSGSDYSSVVSAARDAGLTNSAEDYWIFADFASPGGYSGVGTFYSDDTLSASNANYRNAGYGITYSGYWSGTTPMHEHGHNMGAVQHSAPDASGAGHCDGHGGQDVMCYNDGGPQWDSTHECGTISRLSYDACYNDYFHTKPAPGSYLATKHNIGANKSWAGFDNPFLSFGTTTTVTFEGGLSSLGTAASHTFSAAGGAVTSALTCSGGRKSGLLSSTPASIRQEVLNPAGTVLGSLTVTCDGVTRRLSVTSGQAGVHTLRVTKTAGGTGTTSYTAGVTFTK